jgi:hypothetical protein
LGIKTLPLQSSPNRLTTWPVDQGVRGPGRGVVGEASARFRVGIDSVQSPIGGAAVHSSSVTWSAQVDIPATTARLRTPYGVAADAQGNLFIADYDNERVCKVNPDDMIMTVAGTDVATASADGAWRSRPGCTSRHTFSLQLPLIRTR